MYNVLWVGVGGFVGAILRYAVSGYVQAISGSIDFPYGTLSVNVIGCFFIGLLSFVAEEKGVLSPQIRMLILVRLLGSSTTFSTFSNETMELFMYSENLRAVLNLGAHIAFGLLAVWIGRTTAYLIWR